MFIFRYLTREITGTLCAVTSILLLIFLSNQFARYLAQAAGGKFAGGIVLRLMAVEIPHLLGILLPLGLFLAILLAYGRLYMGNELTVMIACGMSRLKLILFTLPITFVILFIVAVLNLWLSPHLLAYRDRLMAQTGTAMELQTALPGRFQVADAGKRIFYVESMSADRQHMKNIFMAQLANKTENPNIPPWIILTAQSGYQMIDKKTGDRFFVTVNGKRYQGTPGSKGFQIIRYQNYGVRVETRAADVSSIQETLPTSTLLRNTNSKTHDEAISELQWRFSMPIATLLLALLAIPLSRVNPRQSRYLQFLPAILIYIVYANLLLVGRNWIEQGTLSSNFGLWWIHGLLLILTFIIWLNEIGWLRVRQLFRPQSLLTS